MCEGPFDLFGNIPDNVFEPPDPIRYPGAAGDFFGDALEKADLVAFCGETKIGKSFLMVDLAYRAMQQGRKVAFFEIGDLSESALTDRFLVRAAAHPSKSPSGEWPCIVNVPTKIHRPSGSDMADLEYKEKTFAAPLGEETAKAAMERLAKEIGSDKSYLRTSCLPCLSVGVEGIRAVLKSWANDGFAADVVVIDSADGLSTTKDAEGSSYRQEEVKWMSLRNLSREFDCLMVVSTQPVRDCHTTLVLNRRNLAEDKYKMIHCSGIVGVNKTHQEKEVGIMRLNWIALRDAQYDWKKCVHLATCLPLANPCVQSCF